MKNLFVLALGALLFTACSEQDTNIIGQKTTMEVQAEYNIGRIAKGEKIKTDIKVTNTGDYPLVIADVKGQCSCTVTEKPDEPIAPGESDYITSVINTENFMEGAIAKAVTITGNTKPSSTKVVIKATIIR